MRGEEVTLKRDCEAVIIPAGHRVIIPEGTEVTVVQALGGSYTVYAGGALARIDGEDGDAIGLESVPAPDFPDNAPREDVERMAWDQMRTCFDPEIPINVVDLGLVYDCALTPINGDTYRADVKLTLTAPGCGMGTILVDDVRTKLQMIPQIIEADVELVFDPPWNQSMMSEEAKLQTGMY